MRAIGHVVMSSCTIFSAVSIIFEVPTHTVRLLSFLVSETRLDRSNIKPNKSSGKSGAILAQRLFFLFVKTRFVECTRKRPRFDGSVGDIARVVGPCASSLSGFHFDEDKNAKVSVSLIGKTLAYVDTTDGTHADVVYQSRGPPQRYVCSASRAESRLAITTSNSRRIRMGSDHEEKAADHDAATLLKRSWPEAVGSSL